MRKANISRLAAGLGLGMGAWLALAAPASAAARPAPHPAPFIARALPPDLAAPPRPPQAVQARLTELSGQREFQYAQVESQPSAWDVFWTRFWRQVARWLSSRSYQGFWKWVLYALFIGAAVFIVLKLLQVDLTAAFGRSPRRRASLDYDTAAENIHELDFATRLREAEDTGNYRLALRLGYLELLKKLTDQGLIDWQPDKTNHAYLRELAESRPAARAPFGELTRQFEYVWYGELALPAAGYRQARAAQQQLGQQLSPAGRRAAA